MKNNLCFLQVFLVLITAYTLPNYLQAQDLPNPPSNLELIHAGSYVIPLEQAKQETTISGPFGGTNNVFNVAAYGLVYQLLDSGVPVKWVIRAGKNKDDIDFTAEAARILPSAIASSELNFSSSAFVIDTTLLDNATSCNPDNPTPNLNIEQLISDFGNNIAVYQLANDEMLDIRYTLNYVPNIAILSDGWGAEPQANILEDASIPYTVLSNIDFFNEASCYTFVSQPHIETNQVDIDYANTISSFVNNGGNFLAQCVGLLAFENIGFYQTTNGILDVNIEPSSPYTFINGDLPIMQFEGNLPDGLLGTTGSYRRANNSDWLPYAYAGVIVGNNSANNEYIVSAADLNGADIGGNMFYCGGHEYSLDFLQNFIGGQAIEITQARRMFLNACFVPANITFACAGNDICICEGESVELGCTISDEQAEFIWSPAEGLSCTDCLNPIATPTETTTYTMTPTSGNCNASSVTVSILASPPEILNLQYNCNTDASAYTVSFGIVANSNVVFDVIGDGTLNGNTFTSNNINAGEEYNFVLTAESGCDTLITGSHNCIACNPTATMSGGGSICENDNSPLNIQIDLTGTADWIFVYAIDGVAQMPPILATNSPYIIETQTAGEYSLLDFQDANCIGTASGTATIEIITQADASITPIETVCLDNDNISLEVATQGGIFSGNGISNTSQGIFSPAIAGIGTHTITYEITGLCGDSKSIDIEVNPLPAVSITGNEQGICKGESILLEAIGSHIDSYLWNDDSNSTFLEVSENGTYQVTANNECGTASDEVAVSFQDCNTCKILVPNSFSPNEDGANDIFQVISNCALSYYELQIFNRWGKKIFDSNDGSIIWNGKTENIDVEIGVYVYLLKYSYLNDEISDKIYNKKGNVTLIR